LDTDLSAENKILATGSLTVPVRRYILELLTGAKNCKNWIREQGNCKPSMDRRLKFGNFKVETESTIVAAQDQAINTN